jgi:hypothetical protein
MKLITRARVGYAATLATGVAIGLAAFGIASAAPSAPASGGAVHHYTLAASAFAPDGLHTPSSDYFNQWDPTNLSNNDPARCFNVGLVLPNGARLKSVTVYFTEGNSPVLLEINRQKLANNTSTILVRHSSGTTGGSPFYTSEKLNIPASKALVNTATFAYSAGVCPLGTGMFSGINIAYTG